MIQIINFYVGNADLSLKTGRRLFSAAKILRDQLNTPVTLIAISKHEIGEFQVPQWVGKVLELRWTGSYEGLIKDLAKNLLDAEFKVILAPHNSFFKEVLPQLAGKLDLPMLSDVTQIHGDFTFSKQTYSGSVVTTYRVKAEKLVLTVRTNLFAEYSDDLISRAPDETSLIEPGSDQVVELRENRSERPDLQTASVVVTGGRALGSREAFESIIFPLADKLNAAVGATRAAVDSGYAPNDWQVGQTGKSVAPDVYIAVGVSGAVQHIAGIKDSKFIAVINKDPNAPIFDYSDLFLEADLFEVVPELIKKL